MIETRRLKNVVIFIQTILSFVLSKKRIYIYIYIINIYIIYIYIYILTLVKTNYLLNSRDRQLFYVRLDVEKKNGGERKVCIKLIDFKVWFRPCGANFKFH